jgi:drug/metabolite transporter (DMT)-like permease
MLGAALVAIGTLAEEVGASVSKYSIARKMERQYTLGFASNLAALIAILALGVLVPAHFFAPNFPGGFVFSIASLPTLLLRIVLEVAQAHISWRALIVAERSTFAFIRVLTIPLLLLVDVMLGYPLSMFQVIGICFVVGGLLFLFQNHGIKKLGAGLVLFTALNAVATISLFKYDIEHFNSVEVEQGLALGAVVVYFFLMAHVRRERPLAHLLHPAERVQLLTGCISNTALSFAYLYLPPSVATAGKRALSGLFALVAGAFYFNERHIAVKITTLCLVAGGLILLAIQ